MRFRKRERFGEFAPIALLLLVDGLVIVDTNNQEVALLAGLQQKK